MLNATGEEITDSTHIGVLNPFRYRSYYFDTETGFYFLKSRYYDPETGRFISIDDISYLDPDSINGLNLYAYCLNDPINYADPNGHLLISTILIGCLIAFSVASASSVISQGIQYGWNEISIGQVLIDGLLAALSVVLATTGISLIASIGISATMGFGQYVIGSAFHGESLTLQEALLATALGGIGGIISNAGVKNIRTLKNIYENLNGRADSGVKALVTTIQRYGLDSKQLVLVKRLYGTAIRTAVEKGIHKQFISSTVKISTTAFFTPLANIMINLSLDFLVSLIRGA